MEPLDLTLRPPRPSRATLLGYFFLPRTIDKLRAELPGGKIGPYLNHATGFSAYVVRKLGLDMEELRAVVGRAKEEEDVVAWLSDRIDRAGAEALNAKLETFVVTRMSPQDQVLLRKRHPVMAGRPELDSVLDILDADDRRTFATI